MRQFYSVLGQGRAMGFALLMLFVLFPALSFAGDRQDEEGFTKAYTLMNEAVQAMNRGQNQQALEMFMHLLEEGHCYGPQFRGIRRSFLLGHLKRLADKHHPTLQVIRVHAEKTIDRLLQHGYQAESMEHMAYLCEIMKMEELLVDSFQETMGRIARSSDRRQWAILCLPALIRAERYQDLLKYIDLTERAVELVNDLRKRVSQKPPDLNTLLSLALPNLEQNLRIFAGIYRKLGDEKSAARIEIQLSRLKNIGK